MDLPWPWPSRVKNCINLYITFPDFCYVLFLNWVTSLGSPYCNCMRCFHLCCWRVFMVIPTYSQLIDASARWSVPMISPGLYEKPPLFVPERPHFHFQGSARLLLRTLAELLWPHVLALATLDQHHQYKLVPNLLGNTKDLHQPLAFHKASTKSIHPQNDPPHNMPEAIRPTQVHKWTQLEAENRPPKTSHKTTSFPSTPFSSVDGNRNETTPNHKNRASVYETATVIISLAHPITTSHPMHKLPIARSRRLFRTLSKPKEYDKFATPWAIEDSLWSFALWSLVLILLGGVMNANKGKRLCHVLGLDGSSWSSFK